MVQQEIQRSPWRSALNIGLIGAVALVLLSLIGMVEVFNKRDIVYKILSMGQILLLGTTVFIAYLAAKRGGEDMPAKTIGLAVIAGVTAAAGLALLVAFGKMVNLHIVASFSRVNPIIPESDGFEK